MAFTITIFIILLLYIQHRFGLKALPEHLRYKWHTDYIFPFCMIPRSLTSLKLRQPPRLLIGSKYLEYTEKDYGDQRLMGADPVQHIIGAWALTFPLHFTATFLVFGKAKHFRIGIRWDTIDDYYTTIGLDFSDVEAFPGTGNIYHYRGKARR